MKVMLANIPFIEYQGSQIWTGPQAGCRFPWNERGITPYKPFPFYMAWATTYLKEFGYDVTFYDGVALNHWSYSTVKEQIQNICPEVLVIELHTPPIVQDLEIMKWAKVQLGCKTIAVGPHCYSYHEELLKLDYVDYVVIGEYEKPLLDILKDGSKKMYHFNHLEDLNTLNGKNFIPYRPEYLGNYLDPAIPTNGLQLQMNTSRGCPFKCTYCQIPKVMNDGKFRRRDASFVLDEIKQVQKSFSIGSIFFDDDTWNIGKQRVEDMCRGLKEINIPWSMMGRLDTTPLETFELMMDSGCIGMRFGIESFNQKLLDNVQKNLKVDTIKSVVHYLLTHCSNMVLYFTSMKNLPGSTGNDWENDLRTLQEFKELGSKRNNIIRWQNTNCVAFPGTDLWEEFGLTFTDPKYFRSGPNEPAYMAEAVGWCRPDYTPKAKGV